MRSLAKILSVLLVYCIGIQPTVAHAQTIRVQTGRMNGGAVNAGVAVPRVQLNPGSISGQAIQLSVSGVLPSLPGLVALPAPGVPGAGVALPLPTGGALPVGTPDAVAPSAVPAALDRSAPAVVPVVSQAVPATPGQAAAAVQGRLSETAETISIAGKELKAAKTDETSRDAGTSQFNALTGELFLKGQPAEETAGGAEASAQSGTGLAKPRTTDASEAKSGVEVPAAQAAETPAKGSWKQVFKDPERNKSFWRYLKGYAVFLVGFQAYMVGLPYLISAFTKNTLKESHDARLENAEALKALIRQNRSLARVAHWASQAVAYVTVPLFTAKNADNPKKWLVRSMLIRSGLLISVVGLFFASGIFSMPVALAILFGFIGIHSFFQGLTVTTESASKTRVFGDKSVTPEERRKANSILTFVASIISIIGPALAGQLAQVKDFFGKTGVGGVLVYGLYGVAVGVAGLIYASAKMFGNQAKAAEKAQAAGGDAAAAPVKGKGFFGTIKALGVSLKDGIKLILKNRFLRTMLGLTLVSYLFSDPLIFNVLPEFAAGLIQGSSSMTAILNLPVIGWFFKGLISTPMGYFALMNVMASVGSIVATSLVKPLTKLFNRLGFKTEESLMVPFYIIAALEVPLFWLMIFSPSMLSVILLYGLQSFVLGFAGIAVAGVDQKVSGSFSKEDLPKVLAAQSFVGIVAAIISTLVYGFLLGNIAITTSLYIAAIATTVLGALRLAAPFMAFSRESRRGEAPVEGAAKK
ncbi:MAG: hypothetical protein HZB91_12750 [Elusimicrobia bacterium]|nr:hypothetical protein [Elusimicrobiota bacterium]